ncbi:hypothetical protein A2548_07825 [candidate division WOR-1 bacterium RIFOXYD2_FULL_41_8]|nr:MAG: hypothetical protein A2548_07825 [candidate division WOR-1 bacterium RIFOXYD2_FULL_41_8]
MKKGLDKYRLLAIVIVVFAVAFFYLNIFLPKAIPLFMRTGTPRTPFNILILGTDTTYNHETGQPIPESNGRTDSILLAHLNPINFQIHVLSIPRDTYLTIPGYGRNKINAANVFGGIPLVKKTVTGLTKQKIDHFIKIKPEALIKLVDLLGGVSLFVEKDMYYVDKAQGLKIDLKMGRQKLSGQQAHGFIRYRHDLLGDIGRVNRQQVFLKALTKALLKPSNLLKAPFAIKTALGEIETDLTIPQTIGILNISRTATIKTATVSGEAKLLRGAGSVWEIDEQGLKKMLQEYF